jgi:ABC-type transporter Mla MlaB component
MRCGEGAGGGMSVAVGPAQVGLGDHACVTFSDADERLDLVAAFVRGGLRAGQRVLCWTGEVSPERLTVELSARQVRGRAATRRGQLRIEPTDTALLRGEASAAVMVAAIADEVAAAAREGYPGLRLTLDMCWATRSFAAEQLPAFEAEVASLFSGGRLAVICQYDRQRFDAVTLALATTAHPKTVAAQVYLDSPLLRICRQYSPPGVRVAGELDYRDQAVLEQALAESCRLDRHITVNLSGLAYIDATCAATIVQTALRLPASRRMTVWCRGVPAKMIDLVGARDVPRLRVVAAHDQP